MLINLIEEANKAMITLFKPTDKGDKYIVVVKPYGMCKQIAML